MPAEPMSCSRNRCADKRNRRRPMKSAVAALAACAMLFASPWLGADVTIGISLPLTGPASGLGIPVKNGFALWPGEVAGEKLNLILLDDASDPTAANQNARRFV